MWWKVLCAAGLAWLCGGCDLPRDPHRTLDRVQEGVLRVGVVDNRPWAITGAEGEPVRGVEAQLIQEFAALQRARVEWIPGAESNLMEGLREFELDAVIGGITSESPYNGHVGFSAPYFSSRMVLAVPPGVPAPGDLKEKKIGFRRGDAIGSELKRRGANAVPLERPRSARAPVAVAHWEAKGWGWQETPVVLNEHQHVLAVPPGENKFLVALEKFLVKRRGQVENQLRQAAALEAP